MEALLLVAGAALGLIVPFLFTYAFTQGIERSPFPRTTQTRLKTVAIAAVGGWTLLIWAASLSGLIRYQPGDSFPRFIIPLMVPVIAVVALAASSSAVRTVLDHVPLGTLVGVQTFRLAGGWSTTRSTATRCLQAHPPSSSRWCRSRPWPR
jgi:hypothetical protein